jgi:hypothetical protein
VGVVPKRGCLLALAYYAFPRWYEFGERRWNDILTGENRRTPRKTCPSATLSTTNPTWIDPGVNPGLRGGRPATSDLGHGTAFRWYLTWLLNFPLTRFLNKCYWMLNFLLTRFMNKCYWMLNFLLTRFLNKCYWMLNFLLTRFLNKCYWMLNFLLTRFMNKCYYNIIIIILQVHNLLSETLGIKHVSEIGIFRISEW